MKVIQKQGFTLLELVIVIIIVGVLASLALPRFFASVEYSRSAEAWQAFAAIRKSLERCYIHNDGNYNGCTIADLDLEDPGNSPGSHFSYVITANGPTGYYITATRRGVATSTIRITQGLGGVTRSGTGAFENVD